MHGKGNGTGSSGVVVLDSLSTIELTSSVGTLNDNGGLGLAGSLQDGIGAGRTV